MPEVTVKRHDRFQIELKVSCSLPKGARHPSYEFDLYFFAPRSLGVHRGNYPKTQFCTDLQSYPRLTTPAVSLDRFARGPASSFARLRAVIEDAGIREASGPPSSYECAIKLFCSMLKSAVRDFSDYIRQTADPDDREQLVTTFVDSLQEVSREYRALRSQVHLAGVATRTLEV